MGLREMAERSSLTDWCIMLFTLVLAGAAVYQFVIMSAQLNKMQEQLRQTDTHFRASQRPWVGLSEMVTFTGPFTAIPPDADRPDGVPKNTVIIKSFLSYKLQNYGNSPAAKTGGSFFPEFVKSKEIAIARTRSACEQATKEMDIPATTWGKPSVAIMMPKEILSASGPSWSWIESDVSTIRGFWIAGCLVYSDTLGGGSHYTRYLLTAKPAVNAKPTVILNNPRVIMYLPIASVEIRSTEAD